MMDGVGKLREFVDDQFSVRGQAYKQGMAIADEIEREIAEAEAFCRRVEEAARNSDELDVFGVAYMPLPVDADGVPIRVGDTVEFGESRNQGIVKAVNGCMVISLHTDCDYTNYAKYGLLWNASACRHVKPRTLEDVLADFANRVCNSGHQWGLDAADVIPEYADEIRELLGGDA